MRHIWYTCIGLAVAMSLSGCALSDQTETSNTQAAMEPVATEDVIVFEEDDEEYIVGAPPEEPPRGGSGIISLPEDIYAPGPGGAPGKQSPRPDKDDPPSPVAAPAPAPAPQIPDDIPPEYAEILEQYKDDPETQAVILAMLMGQDDGLEATAAAGPTFDKACQAETTPRRTLLITCQDLITGELSQATHPIGTDLKASLEMVARDLAGPGADIGRVEVPLCFWSETIQFTDSLYFGMCPEWDYRYSVLAEEAAEDFDTGRIAHHAPQQMVLEQPYFLEVAIQPLQKDSDQDSVDTSLTAAMGTGLAPGSTEGALDLSFDTIRAGSVMSVSASGAGYEIIATTPAEQPVLAGSPTVWQWQVTPHQVGSPLLIFTVSETVKVNDRSLARTVKTIPLNITVTRLDDLLADSGPPDVSAGIATRSPAPETPLSTTEAASTASIASTLAPDTLDPQEGAGLIHASTASGPDTDIPGCTWVIGPDPDRQAMVLSNLAYSPPVSRLAVTHEDGARMTEALSAVGFSVLQCEDLGQRQTVRALSMLGRMAKARTDMGAHPVTFFYYSGHGVNIEGTNFILPTDIPGASPDDIRDMGVSFEQIFNRVSSTVAPTSFVVFDACRTVMDDQSRGLMRAYSPVGWASGVFQAFATEPGKTAADDGVYSEELASNLSSLPDPANVVFKRVQDAVAARTGQKQRPVYTDGTTGGDFYFKQASE
ncbi:MAG: caspase family protein [Alphaproteobacteria bacterium]|nr:caspase family protein [Alphaproteobacteria bacterium]